MENIFLEITLSLLLGALFGIEREIRKQHTNILDFAGFRTYIFISLFGYLVGFLSFNIFNSINLFIISLLCFFILIILTYVITYQSNQKQISLMSQMLAMLAFFIGFMISLKLYQISITLTITITTILFLGHKLHVFAKKITQNEIFATLKFAIISLIILPLLPNKNYSPMDFPVLNNLLMNQNLIPQYLLKGLDIFNFYYLWLMVVFISAIAYIGYILIKIIGTKKGILITGFLGGLMSSTALTSSFSIESKKYKHLSLPLAIGIIIASSVMFFRVLFEVLILNSNLFWDLFFSLGLMGIAGILFAVYLYYKKHTQLESIKELKIDSPFSLVPALKFAILFTGVLFITKFLTLIYGNSGIYFISFISGITDVDAITISLSKLALEGSISNSSAQLGIIIGAFANTFFKAGIAYYLGSKSLFKIILIIFSLIVFIGGLSLII
ncbi:MAG: MgtC/SapB family protein [Nanoarchaeota archaeon]